MDLRDLHDHTVCCCSLMKVYRKWGFRWPPHENRWDPVLGILLGLAIALILFD